MMSSREHQYELDAWHSKIQDMWSAGYTKRWHTHRMQTEDLVGRHSHGVSLLILMLHPSPSKNLLAAAILHDLPEAVTGDMPANFKWSYPEFAKMLNSIEDNVAVDMGCQYHLEEEDNNWLKACDRIEALMFSINEMLLGNRHALLPAERLCASITKSATERKIPQEAWSFFLSVVKTSPYKL